MAKQAAAQVPYISVIMACYLGEYSNAATDRERKFIRALNSFSMQDIPYPVELVVVADGCGRTHQVVHEWAKTREQTRPEDRCIKLLMVDKPDPTQLHRGIVRNYGLRHAMADIISYLDSDDLLQPHHLRTIFEQFPSSGFDWAYMNDFIAKKADFSEVRERNVIPQHGCIGTSSLIHKRSLPVEWKTGYAHDWWVVQDLLKLSDKHGKLQGGGYIVCHVPNEVDF